MKVKYSTIQETELKNLLNSVFVKCDKNVAELQDEYRTQCAIAWFIASIIASGCCFMCMFNLAYKVSYVWLLIIALVCDAVVLTAVRCLIQFMFSQRRQRLLDSWDSIRGLAISVRSVWEALEFVQTGEPSGLQFDEKTGYTFLIVATIEGKLIQLCELPDEMILKYREDGILDFTWIDSKSEELKKTLCEDMLYE